MASREQLAESRNDHLSWMKSQHEEGNVLFSGPTVDRSVGIYVITAASAEQAHRVADADPFHANRLRNYEMLEWEIHQILGAGPFSSPSSGGESVISSPASPPCPSSPRTLHLLEWESRGPWESIESFWCPLP